MEKCNVSALDNVFRTPLHWAAVLGHSNIVGQLLGSQADCTSSDANGATPLHYAAQNNYDVSRSLQCCLLMTIDYSYFTQGLLKGLHPSTNILLRPYKP